MEDLEVTHPKLYNFLKDFCEGKCPHGITRIIGADFYNGNTIVKRGTINRNDECLCGSGKKYKKCCMNIM